MKASLHEGGGSVTRRTGRDPLWQIEDSKITGYLEAVQYSATHIGILPAPTFRYALVGVEVDEFRTYCELLEESPAPTFPGLVVAETAWQGMLPSSTSRPFSSGYVWKPYEGEVYKPLLVSSDLKDKLNELLILQ